MRKIRLGRTGLLVSKTAFGALPIQRVDRETATQILRRAYEAGINFFDTAHGYTDSEEKIGEALSDVREQIIIATKAPSRTRDGAWQQIETSLKRMKTDYIDLIQLHNPPTCPDPDDRNSAYAALLEAKEQGLVRHIGITNHRTDVAEEAVQSGLYETLQYPLNYLSNEREQALIQLCAEHDVGLIAMKALSGGLLTRADAPFAWMEQYDHVVPIWGIQRLSELEEFIALENDPPRLDGEIEQVIAHDLKELQGDFCRGCGYCLPCPQEIVIPASARMSLLLRRAPAGPYLQPEWQAKMDRIDTCIECGQCRSRCPYQLDVPNLLRRQLKDYRETVAAQNGAG